MSAVVDKEGARRADLAAIHIAKKQLGWDDDTYRDILFTVCRVRSSAELDFAGRKRFLEHLRACGYDRARQGRQAPAKGRGRAIAAHLTGQQRLMFSLWQQLADAGKVEHRSMAALIAYAKRQTGVDRLEWLNIKQTDLVIESLKRWLAR